jgi:ribosomal protein S27AE
MNAYYRKNAGVMRATVLRSRSRRLERVREADRARGFRETDETKNAARNAVKKALRRGELVRQPCERCGAAPADAHHDDYSKPLAVRWLCEPHHGEEHRVIP